MYRYMDATMGMGCEEISDYCKKVKLDLFHETETGRSCSECDNWIFTCHSSDSEAGGVCCALPPDVDEAGYSRWKKTRANDRCLMFKQTSSEEEARRNLLQRYRAIREAEIQLEVQLRCSLKSEGKTD